MKKFTRLISILLLSLIFAGLISACGKKDPLIGSWTEPVSGISLAFDDNSNVVISMHETSYTMQYAEQAPDVLIIKVSTDGTIPDLSMKYKADKEQLTITENGIDTIFKRVK
jgi:hypothetical protein